MKKNKLIILETMDEARYIANLILAGHDRLVDCAVLSLNPNIQSYLEHIKIPAISSARVTDVEFHQAVMDKCEQWENFIRRQIESQSISRPETFFENAYWHFTRLIWRHFLWNIELLDRFICAGSYEEIISFKYDHGVTLSPWIEDNQLYMGDIVEQIGKARGIPVLLYKIELNVPKKARLQPTENLFVKLCNKLSFLLLRIATSIVSKKKSLLIPSFKTHMNMVCDALISADKNLKISTYSLGRYGLMEMAQAFIIILCVVFGKKINTASIGYPVDFAFPVMTFARYYKSSYDNKVPREYIRYTISAWESQRGEGTVYKGVDLFELIKHKIENDLLPYMMHIHFQAFGLEKGMRLLKPNAVISQMNGEIYAALGSIAKMMDIPSILISHGSHVYHKDKYAAKENDILARNILVGDYRYSAVQSPLARELALRMLDDPARIVNIRPTLWGRAVKRRAQAKSGCLTIVHAGTFKLRHNRRFIYETADEFVQGLQDLIEAVAPFPRLRLILKIRPDIYELSLDTMKALLPKAENVVIEAEKPFLEVLKEADLVVSFSSTTIEEALSNDVPVLLYGGDGRYAHIPVEPFSDTNGDIDRAVTFVNDQQDLKKYMTKLNALGSSFHVPEEAFRNYRFNDNEVVDLTEWIIGLREVQS
jgi:hypothetical protein